MLIKQLLDEFTKKESIILEGSPPAQVLLGRDTRPSGENLLEAAKQVLLRFDLLFFFVCFYSHSSTLSSLITCCLFQTI